MKTYTTDEVVALILEERNRCREICDSHSGWFQRRIDSFGPHTKKIYEEGKDACRRIRISISELSVLDTEEDSDEDKIRSRYNLGNEKKKSMHVIGMGPIAHTALTAALEAEIDRGIIIRTSSQDDLSLTTSPPPHDPPIIIKETKLPLCDTQKSGQENRRERRKSKKRRRSR